MSVRAWGEGRGTPDDEERDMMVDGPEIWADRGLVGARAYPDEGDGGGEERVEGRVGVFAESEVASDARASLGGPASVAALEGVLHDSAHRLRRGRREGVDGGGEVSARGERGGDGRGEGGRGARTSSSRVASRGESPDASTRMGATGARGNASCGSLTRRFGEPR